MQKFPSYWIPGFIPIIWEIGDRGGWLYKPGGSIGWVKPEDVDTFQTDEELKKWLEERQAELINYSFSERGMEIFLQALGIVKKGQGFKDIEVPNPRDYYKVFDLDPNELPGVKIEILFRAERSYDRLREIRIGLILEPEFLEAALQSFNT